MNMYRAFGRTLHAVSQFHESAILIKFAQTIAGRVVVVAAAAGLLYLFEHTKILIIAVAMVAVAPESRKIILSMGFFAVSSIGGALRRLVIAVPIGLAFLAAKNFQKLPTVFRRRPQLWMHAALWGAMGLAWLTPGLSGRVRAAITAVAAALPLMIWRAGYMVMSGKRGTAKATSIFDHLFYVWPVYMAGAVPYGKGHDHLSRHEAKTKEAFARAQLAGLKLLILAVVWRFFEAYLAGYLELQPKAPSLDWVAGYSPFLPLEEMIRGGDVFSLPMRWATLLIELVRMTLAVAVPGHIIIGGLRLCGFYVNRNTYKPLLADSILEFWNRFYHYFKELLVDFFFFPTYLRVFKQHPRLRMFTAVFAAAFLGNMYFHTMLDPGGLIEMKFEPIGQFLLPRTVYCLLLATGVCVSMLRQQQRRGAQEDLSPGMRRLVTIRRIVGVWFFYAMIHIWNLPTTDLTVSERNRFFLSLFGI